jgi:hypothetical protein
MLARGDLQRIIDAWPDLDAEAKLIILAMVERAKKPGEPLVSPSGRN